MGTSVRYHARPVVEQAKRLWLRGFSLRKIASQLDENVSHATISLWRDKYNWDIDFEEVDSRVNADIIETETERRIATSSRALMLLDEFTEQVAGHLEKARANDQPIEPHALHKLASTLCVIVNQQRLILGEATERTETSASAPTLKEILLESV